MRMSSKIPRGKFNQWQETLMETDARYLSFPLVGKKEVYVQIECSSEEALYLNETLRQITTNIIEKKAPWWKKYLNKFRRIEEWI